VDLAARAKEKDLPWSVKNEIHSATWRASTEYGGFCALRYSDGKYGKFRIVDDADRVIRQKAVEAKRAAWKASGGLVGALKRLFGLS
jgi:hypothetical protein